MANATLNISSGVSSNGISLEYNVGDYQFMNVLLGGMATEIAINNGGLMTVSSGGYAQHLTINSGGSLTVHSGVIFAGLGGSGHAIYNNGGAATITGGTFTSNLFGNTGGAIYNAGSLIVNGGIFSSNMGLNSAVYATAILNAGTATILAADFSNNSGENAAAVRNEGSLLVIGGTFTSNTAAIGNWSGSAIVNNVTFLTNSMGINNIFGDLTINSGNFTSNKQGIYNDEDATATLTSVNFSYNSGDVGGIINAGSATIIGGTFTSNSGEFAGAIANVGMLNVSNVGFAGNMTESYGGAIYNMWDANITSGSFTGNSAGREGGAIYNISATLNVNNATFTGNSATSIGGAIHNYDYDNFATATINNGVFINNSAASGGGIFNEGVMNISGGLFMHNSAEIGGAIHNGNALTINGGNFVSNVTDYGGAIYNVYELTITGATFTKNSAVLSYGGAIYNQGTIHVISCTFSGNSAPEGGAIRDLYGTTTLTDTVFATASDTIRVGGNTTFTGTISLAGNLRAGQVITATGATIIFDVSSYAAANTLEIITDITKVNGVVTYRVNTASNQAAGDYKLATNAGAFAYTVILTADSDLTKTISLTVNGASQFLGSKEYALVRGADDVLYLSVDNRPTEIPSMIVTISDGNLVDAYDNEISLAEAVDVYANHGGTLGTVVGFANTVTSVGFSSSIIVQSIASMTISGNGAQNTFVSAANDAKIVISHGKTLTASALTLNGIYVSSNGILNVDDSVVFSGGTAQRGAAIVNGGRTTISGITFSDNSADRGGAINNYAESMTLTDVAFSGNSAGSGGAIYTAMRYTGVFVINFTINGASFASNSAGYCGGAIYNQGIATINDATFSGNVATHGGAIYNVNYEYNSYGYNSGSMAITDATFIGNMATSQGGAIANSGGGNDVEATIINGTFTSNSAFGGGAIHNNIGTATISGGTFTSNYASNTGGAILNDPSVIVISDGVSSFRKTSATVESATFVANSAEYGGAIGNYAEIFNLNGGTFTSNSAVYNGGAIYNGGTTTVISGATFIANSASGEGGAIYTHASSITMTDVTFTSNSAKNLGGAIYNAGSKIVTITSATFSGNSSMERWGGAIYNYGSMTLNDVTFVGNSAANGGAIFNSVGILSIYGGTFSGNLSPAGGAIYNEYATLVLTDTYFTTETDTIRNQNGTIIFSGTVSLAGNLNGIYSTGLTATGATIIFDLSSYNGPNTWEIISDVDMINGAAAYNINIAANQANGAYRLATGAGSFDYVVTLTPDSSLENSISLTVNGASGFIGENEYALIRDANNDLYLYVNPEDPSMIVTISDGDLIDAFDHEISLFEAMNVYANDGGTLGTVVGFANTVTSVSFSYAEQSISSMTVSGNGVENTLLTPLEGGAIWVLSGNTLNVTSLTMANGSPGSGRGLGGLVMIMETYGGAIHNGGTMTITEAAFITNSATYGGAIYNTAAEISLLANINQSAGSVMGGEEETTEETASDLIGTMTISNVAFNSNSATNGGAIYNGAIASVIRDTDMAKELDNLGSSSTEPAEETSAGASTIINNVAAMTISSATFNGNSATYGGAIYNAANSAPDMATEMVNLTKDTEETSSGTSEETSGSYIITNASAIMTVSRTSFSSNSATYGGAIYNGVTSFFKSIIRDTEMGSSSSTEPAEETSSGASGETSESSVSAICSAIVGIENCSFTSNSSEFGGAIYNDIGGTMTIVGGTFNDNLATSNGGAIHNTNSTTISYATFTGNTATLGGAIYNDVDATMSISYTAFFTASDTIYNLGTMAFVSIISLAGNLYSTQTITATGATVIFDVSSYAAANTLEIITDITIVNGAANYNINVSATQAGGSYKLATNAGAFNYTVNLLSDNVATSVNLTVNGAAQALGNKEYALVRGADNILYLSVADYTPPTPIIVTILGDAHIDGENTYRECVEIYVPQGYDEVNFKDTLNGGTVMITSGAVNAGAQTLIRGNGVTSTYVGGAATYGNGYGLEMNSLTYLNNLAGGAFNASIDGGASLTLDTVTVTNSGTAYATAGSVVSGRLKQYYIDGDVDFNIINTTFASLSRTAGAGFVDTANLVVTGDVNIDVKDSKLVILYGGAWLVNGGLVRIGGDINITLDLGTQSGGAVYAGSYIPGSGISLIEGTTSMTIKSGNFTGVVGNGSYVTAGNKATQKDSVLTIEGGNFTRAVYAGGYSNGGVSVVNGNTYLNISGGTFATNVYGGSYGNNAANGDKTLINGSTNITIDCSVNAISFGRYIQAGSAGNGVIIGDTNITFTGLGSNLTFAAGAAVSGESEVARTTNNYVSGDKHINFDNFTGDFNALLVGFTNFTIKGDSQVSYIGGVDSDKLSYVNSWGFALTDNNKADGALIWDGGINNFSGDSIELAFDSSLLGTGETAKIIDGNAASVITGWDAFGAVNFVIGGVSYAANWSAGDTGYLSSNGWLLSADESNFDLILTKIS